MPIPKYKTPEDLKQAIDAYFENPTVHTMVYKNDIYEVPELTMEAIAHGLGFMTRQALYNIEKDREEFAETIEYIREKVRTYWQMHGAHGNAAFAQFMLVNLGYKNKVDQQIDHTTGGKQINSWVVQPVSKLDE